MTKTICAHCRSTRRHARHLVNGRPYCGRCFDRLPTHVRRAAARPVTKENSP